jgi:type I restriction enzyme, R subunit
VSLCLCVKSPTPLNESDLESAALEWFESIGYAIAHGPELAPGEHSAERASFHDVVLVDRFRDAIARLNASIPAEAREEAPRKVLRIDSPSLIQTNPPSAVAKPGETFRLLSQAGWT